MNKVLTPKPNLKKSTPRLYLDAMRLPTWLGIASSDLTHDLVTVKQLLLSGERGKNCRWIEARSKFRSFLGFAFFYLTFMLTSSCQN